MAFDRALAGRGNPHVRVHVNVHAKSARIGLVIGAWRAKRWGDGGGVTDGRTAPGSVRGKAPC